MRPIHIVRSLAAAALVGGCVLPDSFRAVSLDSEHAAAGVGQAGSGIATGNAGDAANAIKSGGNAGRTSYQQSEGGTGITAIGSAGTQSGGVSSTMVQAGSSPQGGTASSTGGSTIASPGGAHSAGRGSTGTDSGGTTTSTGGANGGSTVGGSLSTTANAGGSTLTVSGGATSLGGNSTGNGGTAGSSDTSTNPLGAGSGGTTSASTNPAGGGFAGAGAMGTSVAALTQDLSLLLHLDESTWNATPGEVQDASGLGNNGVALSGATTTSNPAKFGRAGLFDGTGYVSVGDNASLRPETAFTVAAWIYPTALDGSAAPGIVTKRWAYGNGTAFTLFLWLERRLYADVAGDDDAHRFRSNWVFDVNAWYHVALVFDGSLDASERARLYVNGQLDTVHAEASSSVAPSDSPLEVGRLRDGGQNFIGSIDEVAYWKRALSATEISALYLATSALE